MKKIILPIAAIAALSACTPKKADHANVVKWPTRVDTVLYSSAKDPHKMDTVLITVGIDSTLVGAVDTIMVPSQDPPYDPVVTLRKVEIPRTGQKIVISTTR